MTLLIIEKDTKTKLDIKLMEQKMSMLANVTRGKIIRPVLIAIYGHGGIGKSTWASKAPKPVFLGTEEGTDHIDTARFPAPKNYEDVLQALKELTEGEHNFQTLVVDSLDWIEPLIFKKICKDYGKTSIEQAAGGFGKGYIEAFDEWKSFVHILSQLRDKRKMNIILLAHPITETHTNPQTQISYQRFELKLHKKSGVRSMILEYVDALFFATYETFQSKQGDDVKVFKSDKRVLCVTHDHNDGFDAKNRYGIKRSLSMDMPWDEFLTMCNLNPIPSLEDIMPVIKRLIPLVKDENTRKLVVETVEKNTENAAMLAKVLEKLKTLTGEAV